MTDYSLSSHPPDICLILRVHGERLWLTSEVIPTVRQLERGEVLDEDDVGAALAYLEVIWIDACQRAVETDMARAALDRGGSDRGDAVLCEKARRYHAALRRLRTVVGRRVAALTGLGSDSPAHEHASF